MPGFTSSKDRLTPSLGNNRTDDLKLKPGLVCHSEYSRTPDNQAKSTLLGFYKWKNKAWMIVHLYKCCLLNILSPLLTYCSEKKISFKIVLLVDNAPGPQSSGRDVMRFLLSSMPADIPSAARGSRSNSYFQVLFLGNTFHKVIASTDSDIPLMDPGKISRKPSGKDSPLQLPTDSRQEVKMSTLTGVWKMTPTLVHDSEAFKTSVVELISNIVEIASIINYAKAFDCVDHNNLENS